jgi:hypothetical protein
MESENPFQVGDWVEIRPVAEVLATLDDQASCDDLLFMPEMVSAGTGSRSPSLSRQAVPSAEIPSLAGCRMP